MNQINGTITTTATAFEESDAMFDIWSSNEGGNVRDAILGCLFCSSVLATCFYLSHQYTVGERAHEQEVEKRRLDEINRKLEEVESKRNEIASVIHGYARTMLSITNDDTVNENDNIDDDSRTILHGNNESEDDDDDDEDEMIDIEAVEPVMRLLELDLEEDNDDDEEVVAVNTNNTTTNMNNTNLYFHEQEQYTSDNNNKGDDGEKEEVHTPVPIPASLLLKAADNNPCAICLEDFVPSDNIIFCSNHITTSNTSTTTTKGGKHTHTHTHTGYPHCFHEECSLDYMFSHTEGVQAPCPLCRKPFLCSMDNQQEEEEQKKDRAAGEEDDSTSTSTSTTRGGVVRSMLPSHPSSISLSDLSEAASAEFER